MEVPLAWPQLFWRSTAALLLGSLAVGVCYFFVDPPVAYFVRDHQFRDIFGLKEVTLPPPLIQAWAPLAIILAAACQAFGPLRRWQWMVLCAAVAVILADQFRESLSGVMGRSWPDTWIHDNPSLLKNGMAAYGFHWLKGSQEFGSFPSGHMARTVAAVSVCWRAYPWSWPLGSLATLLMAVGLVGMNYHFVGDVVAGSVIGGVVGAWCWQFVGLIPESKSRLGSAS